MVRGRIVIAQELHGVFAMVCGWIILAQELHDVLPMVYGNTVLFCRCWGVAA